MTSLFDLLVFRLQAASVVTAVELDTVEVA